MCHLWSRVTFHDRPCPNRTWAGSRTLVPFIRRVGVTFHSNFAQPESLLRSSHSLSWLYVMATLCPPGTLCFSFMFVKLTPLVVGTFRFRSKLQQTSQGVWFFFLKYFKLSSFPIRTPKVNLASQGGPFLANSLYDKLSPPRTSQTPKGELFFFMAKTSHISSWEQVVHVLRGLSPCLPWPSPQWIFLHRQPCLLDPFCNQALASRSSHAVSSHTFFFRSTGFSIFNLAKFKTGVLSNDEIQFPGVHF